MAVDGITQWRNAGHEEPGAQVDGASRLRAAPPRSWSSSRRSRLAAGILRACRDSALADTLVGGKTRRNSSPKIDFCCLLSDVCCPRAGFVNDRGGFSAVHSQLQTSLSCSKCPLEWQSRTSDGRRVNGAPPCAPTLPPRPLSLRVSPSPAFLARLLPGAAFSGAGGAAAEQMGWEGGSAWVGAGAGVVPRRAAPRGAALPGRPLYI